MSTVDQAFQTCPHDVSTFVSEPAVYSRRCPECNARVCTSCKRHGWTGGMIPLVSWMTGTCDDCYRELGKRQEIRKQHDRQANRRKSLRSAWDAGRAANLADVNPHAEPTYYETHLLEQNPWLAAEVAELEAAYAEIDRS